jgi:adenine-specific DNA-methyltransferase
MPPHKSAPSRPVPVDAFHHEDKRVNNPPADSESLLDEEAARIPEFRRQRNPDLDPQLVWRGKDEQDGEDLVIDAPPIYIQEKIVPRVIIENLRKAVDRPELTLFEGFDGLSGWEKVEYYQHQANWSNRMILGDSLQVMASLAEKENLRGKVQMIYVDPPYGIRFGSNWQVSTGKRDVKDGKAEDVTREVEQIKAFRDTWIDGIHSYLSYLRDRLAVARELLTESGSIFVQIGDENVHLVRSVLDEVFESRNFVSQIAFGKTAGQTAQFIAGTVDYILWYANHIENVKFRRLFVSRQLGGRGSEKYDQVELADGSRLPAGEAKAKGLTGHHFRLDNLTSESAGRAKGEGAASWFTVHIDGKEFTPTLQTRWKTNEQGMERLILARRVQVTRRTLAYVRYHDDFPAFEVSNSWAEIGGIQSRTDPKVYVVQTATTAVQRCMLMTTDPGDLVLDPTCGSGTTAFMAEQWGRRWITVDTSRVALALARQRVMGAKFPFYLLADTAEGRAKEAELSGQAARNGTMGSDIHKGFVYQRVPHIMLETIARNPEIKAGMSQEEIDAAIRRHAEVELLYDRPYEDKRKVRVSGPFTVESLAPHKAIAPDRSASEKDACQDDASAFEQAILDNLLKAGVQNGRKKERLEFESLVPYPGEHIQAEGVRKNGTEGTPQRIAASIGPQFGTVSPEFIRDAAREAIRGYGFDLLLVCAFAFDPQAARTVAEDYAPGAFASVADERRIGRVPILLVRMNSDLSMPDVLLKKTGSANLFTVFGEPDVAIERTGDGIVVEIRGVDVYNPTTGEIRSSGTGEIALWMIDTDYDGESFFVRHCYFTGDNDPYRRLKSALKADIDEAAWATLYRTRSRPFGRPESGKIAVKVINHYGDEVLQVYDV